MKIINKPHYECDFCGKKYFSIGWIKRHEDKLCSSNPKNLDKCSGCKFAVKKVVTMTFDREYADPDYPTYEKQVNTYNCSKLNKEMYPFKAAAMSLPTRFPETFEGKTQMPNQCKHFEADIFNLDE